MATSAQPAKPTTPVTGFGAAVLAQLIVSTYESGPRTGPLVQLEIEGPKLNQAEISWRLVAILFSE